MWKFDGKRQLCMGRIFSFGSVLCSFCNTVEVQLSCLRMFSVGWHLGLLQSGLCLPLDCSVAIKYRLICDAEFCDWKKRSTVSSQNSILSLQLETFVGFLSSRN